MTATATLENISEQIQSGRLDEAREALNAFEPTSENQAERMFLQGYVQELSHDREAALATYEQVLEQSPDHTGAIFHAALLCDQGGDDEEAIELYERCLATPPVPVSAMINLAVLYEDKEMLDDAEALLDHVLSEHPLHSRARRLRKSVESSFTMVYDEHTQREREKRDAILDTPIADFELSVRSRNCLRQMNIRTLGDLLRTTESELMSYKNFGETSLNEIQAMLAQRNLRLGQSLQPIPNPVPPSAEPSLEETSPQLSRPVSEMELSVRSRKALQRLGVTTIGELIQHAEVELVTIKNFGETSLAEIKRQLAVLGYSLRQDDQSPVSHASSELR